jgi:hypothetical protein
MKNRANLISSAKKIRSLGQRGDSVLAHINPAEAKYLKENFGGDINPHTGLPQFGFFRSIGKIFKAPVNMAKNIIHHPKSILPIAGSIIGGMLGGPAGSIAGGSLGGALGGGKHKLDHALGGGLVGLGHSLISPMIGQHFNLNPDSFMGRASMMNSPSLGQQFGFGGLGLGGFGSSSAGAGAAATGAGAAGAGATGAGASGLSSMFGSSNLLNTALLATVANGVINGRARTPEHGTPENESMQQAVSRNRPDFGNSERYFREAQSQQRNEAKFPPRGYRGTSWNFFPTAQEQQEQMLRVNEEMANPAYATRYARGGKVKGYFKGGAGGQSDTRPANLHKDDYVMDATTVSLVGDGNSENGAHRIEQEAEDRVNHFAKSGFVRNPETSETVRALLSDGEKVISREQVRAFGGGSIKKGHKELDNFRKNIRKHKGVTKFLPPKSKPLNKYLGK